MPKYHDMYQAVELNDGSVYACNNEGQGVFLHRYDGTWGQLRGTGQTPTFTSPKQFRRWLGREFNTIGRARTVNTSGWEVAS